MNKAFPIIGVIAIVAVVIAIVAISMNVPEPFVVTVRAEDAATGDAVSQISVETEEESVKTTVISGSEVKLEFPGGSEGAFTVSAEGYEPYTGSATGDAELIAKLKKTGE